MSTLLFLIILIAILYFCFWILKKILSKAFDTEAEVKERQRRKRLREKSLKQERESIRKEKLISYGHDMKGLEEKYREVESEEEED
tara:strand:+ start:218 stop:475 length:258 start_codon:yes stop_codon:yes gene_type:complete